MNKVVNRRLYDTETATALASFKTNVSYFAQTEFTETLFRKKTKEYLLYAKGGPHTDAIHKETITPFSINEAKKWAEDRLSGDEYMKIFGTVEE